MAYGTTVRVERFNVVEQCASITGAAKQRFRLKRMRPRQTNDRASFGEIEILPHIGPARMPFAAATCKSIRQSSRLWYMYAPAFWGPREFLQFDGPELVVCIQRMLTSSMHGNWFRSMTSASTTATSTAQFLRQANPDPMRFAYWLAANLPLDKRQRLALLQIDSIVELLRTEKKLLHKLAEDMFCARCGAFLASTRDIFSMMPRGATGTFVNPGGHVHQVLTLREIHAEHAFIDVARSTEDSWFPGYAWSIVHCNACFYHLGWEFNSDEPALQPARFYGFRRTAVTQSSEGRSQRWQVESYELERQDDESLFGSDAQDEDDDSEQEMGVSSQ